MGNSSSTKQLSANELLPQPKKQPSSLLTKDYNNFLVSETSPQNYFGPNYKHLPYNTKVYNKYGLMRKYITLTRKDTKIEKFFSAKYIGLVLLSMSIGYFVPLFLFSLLIRRNVIHVRSRLITFSITSSAIFAAWRAFIYVDNQFFENVSNKFVDKYRAQAILNGFEDYEISKLIPNKTDR